MKKQKRIDTKKRAKEIFEKYLPCYFVDVRLDNTGRPRIKVWSNDDDDSENCGELLLDVPANWLYDNKKVRY